MKFTRANIERYYPLIISLISFGFLYKYKPICKEDTGIILTSSLTIFSVIFGFFLTILTIIKSFESNKGIRLLRKANRYVDFINFIKKPLKYSLYITILSFIGIVLPKIFLWNDLLPLNILVSLSIYALLMSIRFIHLLLLIIDN